MFYLFNVVKKTSGYGPRTMLSDWVDSCLSWTTLMHFGFTSRALDLWRVRFLVCCVDETWRRSGRLRNLTGVIGSSIGNGVTRTLCKKNGLPTPPQIKKNTLHGPQPEECIFRPLRAYSISSLLVSNFHSTTPPEIKNWPAIWKYIFQHFFFQKNSLPTPPEIKKWLAISKMRFS